MSVQCVAWTGHMSQSHQRMFPPGTPHRATEQWRAQLGRSADEFLFVCRGISTVIRWFLQGKAGKTGQTRNRTSRKEWALRERRQNERIKIYLLSWSAGSIRPLIDKNQHIITVFGAASMVISRWDGLFCHGLQASWQTSGRALSALFRCARPSKWGCCRHC